MARQTSNSLSTLSERALSALLEARSKTEHDVRHVMAAQPQTLSIALMHSLDARAGVLRGAMNPLPN